MNNKIQEYIFDPYNAEKNFELGYWYDSQGHVASSVSFYLRTVELSKDDNLIYEALIRIALGFKKQGDRLFSIKSLLYHAINTCPTRPEAFWLLSQIYEINSEYHEAHNAICQAEYYINNAVPTRTYIGYEGEYVILFQKAVTIWYIGGRDEARSMFGSLLKNHTMSPTYINDTYKNLRLTKGEMYFKLPYTSDLKNKLRYKFKGVGKVKQNYSQTYQDMFVLTMLDGKTNGTYLEIGTADPIYNNNTYLLEKQFNWNGISVEINPVEVQKFLETDRKGPIIMMNALDIDYKKELVSLTSGSVVDYLQVDCEPAEVSYQILTKIPFEDYKFAVITFEHDYYADETKLVREKSRKFLESKGYVRVVGDIAPDKNSTFEDWWVHPELVNPKILKRMLNTSNLTKDASEYMLSGGTVLEKWKTTQYPTLEFTTSIPKKGCVIDCAFCPQMTLLDVYDSDKTMSLENFKKVIDKLPKEVRITFSGFTEPWLNRKCTDMLLYAHEQGHPISAFTTGVGMTLEDIERIKDIPFNTGPNGGFCLHLPDKELIAKHPITPRYLEVVKRFKELENHIQGFYVMSMSEVHDDIKPYFPNAHIPEFWSRAGNLLGEAIIKPELEKLKDRFKHMDHGDQTMTCGCDEKLYHNVVLPNGDVSLCCMDYGLKHILGNLYTEEYNDILPEPFSCFTLCSSCENGVFS